MAYALFRDGEKMSRTFPTKEETLKKADEAGLVESGEREAVLEDGLTITPCSPDSEPQDDAALDWTPEKPGA